MVSITLNGADARFTKNMTDKQIKQAALNIIIEAVKKDRSKLIKKLTKLVGGAALNAQSGPHKEPALVCAARHGRENIVQTLVEDHGVDLEAVDDDGDTAIVKAAGEGKTKVVQFLADKGADINVKSFFHGNPLMAAAFYDHADAVAALIELGADTKATNDAGLNALDIASGNANREVVAKLKAAKLSHTSLYKESQAAEIGRQKTKKEEMTAESRELRNAVRELMAKKGISESPRSDSEHPSAQPKKQGLSRIGFQVD